MIILPICNRERILNVEVELKKARKVARKVNDFNVKPCDVMVNGYRYSESHFSKDIATPKSIMNFIRTNSKTGRSSILISTKEEDGVYDIYELEGVNDKVSDGVDNLIGTLILALKNESSTQKGRYLDLSKIELFDEITLDRVRELEFLSKNMDKLNISKYIEEHDLRCLFRLLQSMDEFSFTIIKNSLILEEEFNKTIKFLEPTNSRDYNNLKNYLELSKDNQREYSKLSYVNKVINNKPLKLIQSSHEKVKVYQENNVEAS
ncbi:MAG: hypothetical protein IK997_07415 [Bacilli bacterium]|nr:hypothetical protein [Bacilli bacterium]